MSAGSNFHGPGRKKPVLEPVEVEEAYSESAGAQPAACVTQHRRQTGPTVRVAQILRPTQRFYKQVAEHDPRAERFVPKPVAVEKVCTEGADAKQEHVANGEAAPLGLKERRLLSLKISRLTETIEQLCLELRIGRVETCGVASSKPSVKESHLASHTGEATEGVASLVGIRHVPNILRQASSAEQPSWTTPLRQGLAWQGSLQPGGAGRYRKWMFWFAILEL